MTGAEIVDGEPGTQDPETGKGLDRADGVFDQRPFRDFDDETRRIDLELFGSIREPAHELNIRQ